MARVPPSVISNFQKEREFGMVLYVDFFLELHMVRKIPMVPTSIDADLSNGNVFVSVKTLCRFS